MSDLHLTSLAEAARALRLGTVSSADLTEATAGNVQLRDDMANRD